MLFLLVVDPPVGPVDLTAVPVDLMLVLQMLIKGTAFATSCGVKMMIVQWLNVLLKTVLSVDGFTLTVLTNQQHGNHLRHGFADVVWPKNNKHNLFNFIQ